MYTIASIFASFRHHREKYSMCQGFWDKLYIYECIVADVNCGRRNVGVNRTEWRLTSENFGEDHDARSLYRSTQQRNVTRILRTRLTHFRCQLRFIAFTRTSSNYHSFTQAFAKAWNEETTQNDFTLKNLYWI